MAIYAPITGAQTRAPIIVTLFDRQSIEGTIEHLIELLDADDGDPDLSPNGDELDGNGAEDDFMRHSSVMAGPGCTIADPDLCVAGDDTVRSGPAIDSGGRLFWERYAGAYSSGAGSDEDAEMNGDEGDYSNEDGVERTYATPPRYGIDQSLGPINEREAEREQRVLELGLVRTPTGGWQLPN